MLRIDAGWNVLPGTGGDNQIVITVAENVSVGEVPDFNTVFPRNYSHHLMEVFNSDVEFPLQSLNRLHQQHAPIFNHSAHIVRQSAGGAGYIFIFFVDGNLCLFIQPAQSCCNRGSGGNTSDDHSFSHKSSPILLQLFQLYYRKIRNKHPCADPDQYSEKPGCTAPKVKKEKSRSIRSDKSAYVRKKSLDYLSLSAIILCSDCRDLTLAFSSTLNASQVA